jgi:hypothetical protein
MEAGCEVGSFNPEPTATVAAAVAVGSGLNEFLEQTLIRKDKTSQLKMAPPRSSPCQLSPFNNNRAEHDWNDSPTAAHLATVAR